MSTARRRKAREPALRSQRVSEAVSVMRRRRATDDPATLLEQCLALLDAVVEQSPRRQVMVTVQAPLLRAHASAAFADPVPELDGNSAAIERLKKEIACVAHDAHVPVMILGEVGTGKERVARAIHRLSARARLPFVAIDCGSTSGVALRGHVRGFAGASAGASGPFEQAKGGTVFLDEVGDLPPDAQAALLRIVRRQSVQRVGSARARPIDVRVIAASSTDLDAAVQRGLFPNELHYRLNVFELRVPPLRTRGPADVRRLAEAILRQQCARRHRAAASIASDVWDALSRSTWPGNVRELENVLERMVVAAGGERVLARTHLPDDLKGQRAESAARAPIHVAEAAHPPMIPSRPLPSAADAFAVLERSGFAYGRAAAELGVSRHQLYRLLKRYAASATAGGRALA